MKELQGRTLYFPEMDYAGARTLAAAFRSQGISSDVVPPSDAHSNALGGKCTSGDECYPTRVTLGDFLSILDKGIAKPENAAFFMAKAGGPCRFGQYAEFFRKTLDGLGYKDVPVFSLTSDNAYGGFGIGFQLTAWRGIVASDILRKLLLMTRPYEQNFGDTDAVFRKSVDEVCRVLEKPAKSLKLQRKELAACLKVARERFNNIPVHKKGSFPLIGFVGEIFCRLNTFSNEDIVRKFEQHGAEGWLVGISEWILYTNADEIRRLTSEGKRFTKKYLNAVIKRYILTREEHALLRPFKKEFVGREECSVNDLLKLSLPYLPWYGSLGEMTLSAAGAIYMQKKGASGIVNISSFACMNEIVSEAVFPKISGDLGNFPMKVFYFEGTQQNLDRDIEIFLELARNYKKIRQ